MTVSLQTPLNQYTANGSTTVFAYTFLIKNEDDLTIYLDGVEQTSAFTVSGVGSSGGGAVTFDSPPANLTSVLILRGMLAIRDTDYQNSGDFRADAVNADFDRAWLYMQQLQRILDYQALLFPETEQRTAALNILPAPNAGQVLSWQTDGSLANSLIEDLATTIDITGTIDRFESMSALIAASSGSSVVYVTGYYAGWAATVAGPKGGHFRHKTGYTNAAPSVGAAASVSSIGVDDQAGLCWDAAGNEWDISPQIYNVDMFGAIRGGIVDSTAGFNLASSYALRINGAQIIIPEDTYLIDTQTGTVDLPGDDGYIKVRTASYQWTASGSGTDEYYCELAGGGDPSFALCSDVIINGSSASEGTVGSLAAGEWDYGDNDSLGYSTVYVRLSDGTDPDTKSTGYISAQTLAAEGTNSIGYCVEVKFGCQFIGLGRNSSQVIGSWVAGTSNVDLNERIMFMCTEGDTSRQAFKNMRILNAFIGVFHSGLTSADPNIALLEMTDVLIQNTAFPLICQAMEQCHFERIELGACWAGLVSGGWWTKRDNESDMRTGGWADKCTFRDIRSIFNTNTNTVGPSTNPVIEEIDEFYNDYFFKVANESTRKGLPVDGSTDYIGLLPYRGVAGWTCALLSRGRPSFVNTIDQIFHAFSPRGAVYSLEFGFAVSEIYVEKAGVTSTSGSGAYIDPYSGNRLEGLISLVAYGNNSKIDGLYGTGGFALRAIHNITATAESGSWKNLNVAAVNLSFAIPDSRDNDLTVDRTNDGAYLERVANFGIQTSSPDTTIHARRFSNTTDDPVGLRCDRSRGTRTSPLKTIDGDNLASMLARGNTANGSESYVTACEWQLLQDGNESGGLIGGRMRARVKNNSVSGLINAVEIKAVSNTQALVNFMTNPTQTTVGAAGGASALPATPTGFMELQIAGTAYVIPYYAKA